MSMSEKRYFSLFAQRHTIGQRNNYFRLFELVEQMPQYDNELLTQKLQEEGLSVRHLSSDKNYLYHLILKSLGAFHAGKSAGLKIKEWLIQVEILYEKGLYEQCLLLLKKATQLADKFDLFSLKPEITRWASKAHGHSGHLATLNATLAEARNQLDILDNLFLYQDLYYRMIALRQSIDKARDMNSLAELNAFISQPALRDVSSARSFQARVYFWRVHAMYYYATDAPQKELHAIEHLQQLMESAPNYIKEFPFDYLVTLSRILHLKRHRDDEEFNKLLAHFRAFPAQIKKARRKLESQVEAISANISLSRLIEQKRWKEALELTAHTREVFAEYDRLLNQAQKISHAYMLAYIFLANGRFRDALVQVNHIMNDFEADVRPELQAFTRILNLVVHYELKNFRLLHYAAESALRYLRKKGRQFKFESHIIRYFKKFSRIDDEAQHRPLFEACRKELEEILQDEFERKGLEYFDMVAWLEAHIQQVPFTDVAV
ncbi:MAG: hypothetical protein D6730_01445 [Bacteroidetes bacterium]|nr:MAG: hypothetical protein D6730_01445 [Bacteroidota bacterium]